MGKRQNHIATRLLALLLTACLLMQVCPPQLVHAAAADLKEPQKNENLTGNLPGEDLKLPQGDLELPKNDLSLPGENPGLPDGGLQLPGGNDLQLDLEPQGGDEDPAGQDQPQGEVGDEGAFPEGNPVPAEYVYYVTLEVLVTRKI